jgi:hypothetical protein
MGEKKDEKGGEKDGGKPDRPGAVQHDARGNAVWQWAVESGRHAIENTTHLLRRLEVPGLKLEDDPEVLKDKAEGQQPGDPAGPPSVTGYDPYGAAIGVKAPKVAAKSPPAAKSAPAMKVPPATRPPQATKPAPGTKPAPSLLQRLFRRD